MYKFGASHRNYLPLRPNNLVMWEAIKWYGRRGFRQFDLGRSEPDNQGLNQFKDGWGAKATRIAYFRYRLADKEFLSSRATFPPLLSRAFRLMPIPLLRILGVLGYRYLA